MLWSILAGIVPFGQTMWRGAVVDAGTIVHDAAAALA
jgi:hypothetical protein